MPDSAASAMSIRISIVYWSSSGMSPWLHQSHWQWLSVFRFRFSGYVISVLLSVVGLLVGIVGGLVFLFETRLL
jgi:hypothetical protein